MKRPRIDVRRLGQPDFWWDGADSSSVAFHFYKWAVIVWWWK